MSNCTICLDPLLIDLQAAKCGHVFHGPCIRRWLSTKKQCPNCNKKLKKNQLMKLFLSLSRNSAMQSLQTEITTLNEQSTTLNRQNTALQMEKMQMQHEINANEATIEALTSKLHQQQLTTQSYIQKNIEMDEECDELKEKNHKLNQQIQSEQIKHNKNDSNTNINQNRKHHDLEIDLSLSSDEDDGHGLIANIESDCDEDDDVNTNNMLSDSLSPTPTPNRRRSKRKRRRVQYACHESDASDDTDLYTRPGKKRRTG
eukprot:284488_1